MDLDYPFLDDACPWQPSSMGSDACAAAAAGPRSAPMPINPHPYHSYQQHHPNADSSHPYQQQQNSLVENSLESSQSLLAASYGAVAGSYGSFAAAAPSGLRPLAHSYAGADPLSHSYHSASGEMCFVPVPDARPPPQATTGAYSYGTSLQQHYEQQQQQQRYEQQQQFGGGPYSFGATPSYPAGGGLYSSSWEAPATMLHAGPEQYGGGQYEAPHPFSHQHRSSQPIAVPHAVCAFQLPPWC